MAIPLAGAVFGGSLLSGGLSAWGADKASEEMADAIEQAVALQREQMRMAQEQFTPYADIGRESLASYQQNIGEQPSYQNVLANLGNDPGYQFRLQQGQKTLENSAAARGNLLSGATLKDLAGYSQGLASQEAGAAYGREMDAYNNRQNQLANLMQLGYNASQGMVGQGQAMTNNLANLAMGAGQNQANKYTQYANIGNSFANSLASLAMFDRMYPAGGGAGGGNPSLTMRGNGQRFANVG